MSAHDWLCAPLHWIAIGCVFSGLLALHRDEFRAAYRHVRPLGRHEERAMSARARLAALHDRSSLDGDGLAMACARVPEQTFGEEFWTVLVRASNALWVARELAAGRRCRASRDGDCFAPECPQAIEGRRGYLPHCPLDVDEDEEP